MENLQLQDDDDGYIDNDIKSESDIDVENYIDGDLSTKTPDISLRKDDSKDEEVVSKNKDQVDPLNQDTKSFEEIFLSENNGCHENHKNSQETPLINNIHLKENKSKKRKSVQKVDHIKKSKFPCTQCGKSYKQKKRLESHLKSHSEKKPVENLIETEVKVAENLSENVKVEIISEPEIANSDTNKEELLKCEKCGAHFISQSFFKDHYILCQPEDDITSPKEEIPNIIDYLNIDEVNKLKKVKDDPDEEPEYINGRRLKGKRRFLCNYCGKNYTRKNGLERHILSHTGVKPFQCRECGKSYTTKDTLKTHLLTHSGVKAYKCEVCKKLFTQSSHLSYHMRRHAGEKPHVCSFCSKAFLSSYHLERHKLMHTGVKPFECNLCGKHFVRNTTLRDHLLVHTGEKPFQCQHCGKQFNRKQSLTNHMLVHNGPARSGGSYYSSNLLYNEINIPDVSNMQSISN